MFRYVKGIILYELQWNSYSLRCLNVNILKTESANTGSYIQTAKLEHNATIFNCLVSFSQNLGSSNKNFRRTEYTRRILNTTFGVHIFHFIQID